MITPIQASISGYNGKPATVYSVYDHESAILAVSVEAEFCRERKSSDIVLISNDKMTNYDSFFEEKLFLQGIESYLALAKGVAANGVGARLVFADRAKRSDPMSAIEMDGMNESGSRYRISPDVTNAQVAALASCWYAHKQAGLAEIAINLHEKINSETDNYLERFFINI